MIYTNYQEYKEATREYYKDREGVDAELMILNEKDFDKFNGLIEFGVGSQNLTNDYSCGDKCEGCNCGKN